MAPCDKCEIEIMKLNLKMEDLSFDSNLFEPFVPTILSSSALAKRRDRSKPRKGWITNQNKNPDGPL